MIHPLITALFEAALFTAGGVVGYNVRVHLPVIKLALRGRWRGPGA